MTAHSMLGDCEELQIRTDGQDWISSWHSPLTIPNGTSHGAAGICLTEDGNIVLISQNGVQWDLPAGRTESNESWEQTLRREMREEACARVTEARLLGFCRSFCVAGSEEGKTLVRSFWRAQVLLDVWEPQFEISHRLVVPTTEVFSHLPPVFMPIYRRAFQEAGVI